MTVFSEDYCHYRDQMINLQVLESIELLYGEKCLNY